MLIQYGINKTSLQFFFQLDEAKTLLLLLRDEKIIVPCIFYNKSEYLQTHLEIESDYSQEYLLIQKTNIKLCINAETKNYMIYLLNSFYENNFFPVAECCEILNLKSKRETQIYFQSYSEFTS